MRCSRSARVARARSPFAAASRTARSRAAISCSARMASACAAARMLCASASARSSPVIWLRSVSTSAWVSSGGAGCPRSSCSSSRSSASQLSRCSSCRRSSLSASASGVWACTGAAVRRRTARGLQLLDRCVALDELAAQRRQALLVFLDLRVDGLGLRAPEIDFFLRELLGTGFGDLELLLQLRHLDALGFGDLLEMPRLLLPAQALGFDALEPMGQDVELLLDAGLRRALALQLLVEVGGSGFRFAERVLQEGESLFG